MIKYKYSEDSIDITFKVYKSGVSLRFLIDKNGINIIHCMEASRGWVKETELECEECGEVTCFCPSKYFSFNESRERDLKEQHQKEKLCFSERKENHLRSIKKT